MQRTQRHSSVRFSVHPDRGEQENAPSIPQQSPTLTSRNGRANHPLHGYPAPHKIPSQHIPIPGAAGAAAAAAVAASVTDQAAALRAAVAESKHNRARIEARGDQTRQLQSALQTALDQITKIEHEFARFKQAAEHDRAHYAAVLEENAQLRNRIAILAAEREELLHGDSNTHPYHSDDNDSDTSQIDDDKLSAEFSGNYKKPHNNMPERVLLPELSELKENMPVLHPQDNLQDRECEDDHGPFKQTFSGRHQIGSKPGKSKSQPIIGRQVPRAMKNARAVASRSISPSSVQQPQFHENLDHANQAQQNNDQEHHRAQTHLQEPPDQTSNISPSGALPPDSSSSKSRSRASTSARSFIRRKSSFIGRGNRDTALSKPSRPSTLPLPFPPTENRGNAHRDAAENQSQGPMSANEDLPQGSSVQKPFERALSVRLLRNDRTSNVANDIAVLSDTTNLGNPTNPASPSAKRRGERNGLTPARRAMSANFRTGTLPAIHSSLSPDLQLRQSRDWANRASSRFSASTFGTTATTATSETEATTTTNNTDLHSSDISSNPTMSKKRMSRKWSTCF